MANTKKQKSKIKEADLNGTERKRAQRALQLTIRGLEQEGVKDYVVKVWKH